MKLPPNAFADIERVECPKYNSAPSLGVALSIILHEADRDQAGCIITDGYLSIHDSLKTVAMLREAVDKLEATYLQVKDEQVEWLEEQLRELNSGQCEIIVADEESASSRNYNRT